MNSLLREWDDYRVQHPSADYEVHDWQVFTISSLPSLRLKTYAYLGVLTSRSEGILDADIAIWTFSTSLSATEAAHQAEIRLPTVSGSSGKLVIQHAKTETLKSLNKNCDEN
ncbi:TPA: hypothetical protein EYP66_07610 [Candidatus Poribacteria bacterium]|nr:hypothetical protein [Candidatus Poribacteria bacterium]